MSLKKILTLCHDPDDCTSYYRAMGPLSRLTLDTHGQFTVTSADKLTWSSVMQNQVVFMQRPYIPRDVKVAQLVKRCGVPLWVDYDDDLFNVTPDNPAFYRYELGNAKDCIKAILEMADAISVSTEHLRLQIAPKISKPEKIWVIPNGIDDELIERRPVIGKWALPICSWRGSDTHERDLMTVRQPLIDLSMNYRQWVWRFLGYNPWLITEFMRNGSHQYVPNQNILDYFDFMEGLAPSVHLVPLTDSTFNRSKSNIAWIEATWAGAACLTTKIPEFIRPGVTNYEDAKGFSDGFHELTNPENSYARMNESWDFIKENLRLSKLNEIRQKLLFGLGVMS